MKKLGSSERRCAGGIAYILTYKSVKNINMRVGKDLEVSVSASPKVSIKYIDEFVSSKADWVDAVTKKIAARQNERQYNSKESFALKYSALQLETFFNDVNKRIYPIVEDKLRRSKELKRQTVEDTLRRSKELKRQTVGDKLKRRKELKQLAVENRLNHSEELNQLKLVKKEFVSPAIKIRYMSSCWGVCHWTKNYITLNARLIEKPIKAVEYVLLHEYVHFFHHDHQKGFHDMMKDLMPDYKKRRKLLRSDSSLV